MSAPAPAPAPAPAEYQVCQADSLDRLIALVETFMLDGWRPQGGIAMMQGGSFIGTVTSFVYAQAIVR